MKTGYPWIQLWPLVNLKNDWRKANLKFCCLWDSAEMYMMYVPLDSPLVQHLPTSWYLAWWSIAIPHMHESASLRAFEAYNAINLPPVAAISLYMLASPLTCNCLSYHPGGTSIDSDKCDTIKDSDILTWSLIMVVYENFFFHFSSKTKKSRNSLPT